MIARFVWARSLVNVAAADDEPDVQRFRIDVLRGRLLKHEQVACWVERQRKRDGAPTTYVTVAAPPGWKRGDPLPTDPMSCAMSRQTLAYGIADDRSEHHVFVAAGGVLDRLRLLSVDLAGKYQWQQAQASVYVLTGLTPVVQLLDVRRTLAGRPQVTIVADPDVPTEVVEEHYKQCRAELLGRRARRPFPRGIELVVHATERPGFDTRALWHQWNREHPSESYDTPKAFGQALRDARRRVQASWGFFPES